MNTIVALVLEIGKSSQGKGCPPVKASIRGKLAYHANIRANHVVEWNLLSYFLESTTLNHYLIRPPVRQVS